MLAGVLAKVMNACWYYSFETGKYESSYQTRTNIELAARHRHLIYSDRDKIFIVNSRPKFVRELFSTLRSIYAPVVAATAMLLYYTAANLESDIWMLELLEK